MQAGRPLKTIAVKSRPTSSSVKLKGLPQKYRITVASTTKAVIRMAGMADRIVRSHANPSATFMICFNLPSRSICNRRGASPRPPVLSYNLAQDLVVLAGFFATASRHFHPNLPSDLGELLLISFRKWVKKLTVPRSEYFKRLAIVFTGEVGCKRLGFDFLSSSF